MKITIGADPEFFLYRKDDPTKKPIIGCGRFGGTKKSPIFLSPDGGYLEDGVAVEFNVAPCGTLAEVREKIGNLLTVFCNQFPEYGISSWGSSEWPVAELKKHSQAMTIGCDADVWAWGLREAPQINLLKGVRCAGGHIHIGIDPWPEKLNKNLFIKALDILVLSRFASWQDRQRGRFYGHPGLYRSTSYGVEWRSPDNYWAHPIPWVVKSYVGLKSKKMDVEDKYKVNITENFINTFDHAIERLRKTVVRDDGLVFNKAMAKCLEILKVNPTNVKNGKVGWCMDDGIVWEILNGAA